MNNIYRQYTYMIKYYISLKSFIDVPLKIVFIPHINKFTIVSYLYNIVQWS